MLVNSSVTSSRPRLSGAFNLVTGIFLMLAAVGVLLYFVEIYDFAFFSNCSGPGVCLPSGPSQIDLGPLYTFLGAGIVLVIYSLKLIVFGALSFARPPGRALPEPLIAESKENIASQVQNPTSPPPQIETVIASTKVDRCSFCGAELPLDATYCPNCFQKKRIGAQEQRAL